MCFLLLFFGAPLACPGGVFCGFSAQKCPKVIFSVLFLMTFKGPGAHARTVLSLQRELDLEGWRGSENRRFFDVFFGVEKRGIRECPFAILCDFRSPEGADWVPKWFQTAS